MKFVRSYERGGSGASLLEVLIALSLMATSILGAASAQLSALRHVQEQVHREHASWIAASIAEAMQLSAGVSNALARQRERAQTLLPGARITIADEANRIGAVAVEWASGPSGLSSAWAPGFGSCSMAHSPTVRGQCIALPFASNER